MIFCLASSSPSSAFSAGLLGEDLRDRRGQGRLTVVDVTDGADVDVRLVALELLFRHCGLLLLTCGWFPDSGEPGKSSSDDGSRRARGCPDGLRSLPRRSSPGPPRTSRTAWCRSPCPGWSSAGRSRSRTSRPAARWR